MANMLVSDAVNEVTGIFNEKSIYDKIFWEWEKLGVFLDTPPKVMEALAEDSKQEKIVPLGAIKAMLIEWSTRMSHQATLGSLFNIFLNVRDWELIQDLMQKLIIKKAKTWNDLDEHSKLIALKSEVNYEGKIQTLDLLQGSMNKEEFDRFQDTHIDLKNIPKLFKGGVVSLAPTKKHNFTLNQRDVQSNQEEKTLLSYPSLSAVPKSVTLGTKPSVVNLVADQDTISEPNTAINDHEIPKHFDSPLDSQTSTMKIKYFTSDILGVGSGGTNVYKGTFGQRDVAVKVMSNFKDRFEAENEIKVLQRCDRHENIVRYIYSSMTPEVFQIALELCLKFTLADWVDDSSCVCVHIEPIVVLKQTTQGIGFLHQINIIHRDLKPSNILFVIRGSETLVKISDFGISRSLTPGRNTRTVTRFGGISGWTAAEMLEVESILNKTRRSQTVEEMPKMTTKIDIFSLGCIYYFVLTKGEHPFGDNERLRDHYIETDENILDDMDVQKYDLRLQCNLSLLRIMIAKDPNLRPDADYIINHPIFWTHKKMIDFIDEVSNFVNKPTPDNEDLCVACVDKLERNYYPKISNGSTDGWFGFLDDIIRPVFLKHYKNHRYKAIKLIRILRNYKHHYHEKNFEPEVRRHIGKMPNDFMTFWLGCFPTLINEMRDAFVDLRHETNFIEYF